MVKVVAPVPPLATLNVPVVIFAASSAGMSEAERDCPELTRPWASVVTLVKVPAVPVFFSVRVAEPPLKPLNVPSPVQVVM